MMMTGIPITPASAAPPAAPNTICVAVFAANPNRWNKSAMPYARANRQHVNPMTIAAENRGRMLASCGKLRTRRESAPDSGAELLVDVARYAKHPDCNLLFCLVCDPTYTFTTMCDTSAPKGFSGAFNPACLVIEEP